jgi:glycosyltransferase involved in cell wall biosynthesis
MELAAKSGLKERLVFAGHQYDMPAVWSAMDIYVHLCVVEGFSRAIMEAMATGKPVVAVDAGGNPEAIADEDTGLLIPAEEETQACESALSRLVCSPELRRRLGARAKDAVEEKFSIATHHRAMEKIFIEAANEPTRLERRAHPTKIA